jgi:hypothetical protein
MAFVNYIRKFFKTPGSKPAKVEYIHEAPATSAPTAGSAPAAARETLDEIDFSPQSDLETYTHGLGVSRASVERWISSGLLMPEEIKVAEKMARIMRQREKARTS